MDRKVAAVITAITGDRVIIGQEELTHAIREHFPMLPSDILLELIERILKDPTKIFEQEKLSQYHLFYRLDNQRYLVVIVKKTLNGNYFSSMYSTGTSIRNSHKDLKQVKLWKEERYFFIRSMAQPPWLSLGLPALKGMQSKLKKGVALDSFRKKGNCSV